MSLWAKVDRLGLVVWVSSCIGRDATIVGAKVDRLGLRSGSLGAKVDRLGLWVKVDPSGSLGLWVVWVSGSRSRELQHGWNCPC